MFTKIFVYNTLPNRLGEHDDAAHRCHDVLARQPGFVGRMLGRNCDDRHECVEAIQWESEAHAKEASQAAAQDPSIRAWLEHVDRSSIVGWGTKTVGAVDRAQRALGDASTGCWLLVRWRTHAHVDAVTHRRNGLLMHHEVFAPAPGYRGAILFEENDGLEKLELIAWSDTNTARTRVGEILGAGNELVALHMADCVPGSSLHYAEPILRA